MKKIIQIVLVIITLIGCCSCASKEIIDNDLVLSSVTPESAPTENLPIEYNQELLEMWIKEYPADVLGVLTYYNEYYTEDSLKVLEEHIDISGVQQGTNITLMKTFESMIGAWNNYRGDSPHMYEYIISNYSISNTFENQVTINTQEQIKAIGSIEMDDEYYEATCENEYTLKLIDGRYRCIEANINEFISIISKYGIPMPIDFNDIYEKASFDGNIDEGITFENFVSKYYDGFIEIVNQSNIYGSFIEFYLPSSISESTMQIQADIPTGTIIIWVKKSDNHYNIHAVEYTSKISWKDHGAPEFALDDYVERALIMAVFNVDDETAEQISFDVGSVPSGYGKAYGNIIMLWREDEDNNQVYNFGLLHDLQNGSMPKSWTE